MRNSILVLGATGGVGGALAREMLTRGWLVSALVRDTERARSEWAGTIQPVWLQGDAMERQDVIGAATGVSAVFHGVNPPGYRNWEDFVLPMIENSIAAAREAGGARVVLPGTIYNYEAARHPVVDEESVQDATGKKGRLRSAMERRLAEVAPEVPSLVIRAGDFLGPRALQSWFARALAAQPDKAITYPGRPGIGHSWAFLPDLAKTVADLLSLPMEQLKAAERVQFEGFWDETGDAMIEAIRRVTGRADLPVRAFPWWLMRALAPFGGFPREVIEVQAYWRHPVRLDNQRLLDLLGHEPRTPIDEAVRSTIDAQRGALS